MSEIVAAFLGALALVISTAIGASSGAGASSARKASIPDWEGYTKSIQADLATLRKRCDEQDEKIKVLQEEYGSLKRLFRLSVDTLSSWIKWDRSGRNGQPPALPDDLRGHIT